MLANDASSRVELELHDDPTTREYRELAAFVRCCTDNIERDLGRADWWNIKIVRRGVAFWCEAIAQYGDVVVQAEGNGFDGAVAGREAFCKAESLLRENGVRGSAEVRREVACGSR